MLNTLFNMKKVGVREIVHGFSKLQQVSQSGQSVDITSHGSRSVSTSKRPGHRVKMPNFYKDACKDGCGPEVGDAILKRLLLRRVKPFLDTGFFMNAAGVYGRQPSAWQIARGFNVPLCLTHLQCFQVENGCSASPPAPRASRSAPRLPALAALHHYLTR